MALIRGRLARGLLSRYEAKEDPLIQLDARTSPTPDEAGAASSPQPEPRPVPVPGRDPLERVRIQGVSKRYGRRYALSRVSLEVRRGRPCALMGENGAGKSTLVQMVAGALSVDSGDITVETARGPLSAQKRRRRIGLITHQPMVYGELTALENVEHFARLGGVPAPRERAHRLLAELGLDPDSPKPASQFSRGMLARLSASRALVTGPDLLLLDEAASGLDRHGRRTLVDRVVRLAGEAVVLMATHHEETAARVAQHLVVLRRGRVALDESLRELSEAERLDRIRAALEAR